MSALTALQRIVLYNAYKTQLCNLNEINSLLGLELIMQYLITEQRVDFYELIKDRLLLKIKSVDRFNQVADYINATQRQDLYNQLDPKLPEFIHNMRDLNLLISNGNGEQNQRTFDVCVMKLSKLICVDSDLAVFASILSLQQTVKNINQL